MTFSEWLIDIGSKWQRIWEEEGTFHADPDERPSFFCTFPYPYINGSVHLGHSYSAMKVDAIARYKRMKGFNVLFPQGFHATGEPIVGMAKRLAQRDPIQIKVLKEFGFKEEDIPKFEDPLHIVKEFRKLMRYDMESAGLSIDWRREFVTTPLTPVYSKFIEWQYLTLKAKGYVKQGTHPVIWCPSCQSPTGDHDRLEGEGVSISDFTLLKFEYEDAFLVPATLRPETTYGVTNMYLRPDVDYKKIRIDDNENWIVSAETVIKLIDQEHNIEVISDFDPNSAFGKYCKNPLTGADVIILPAHFIDPTTGTGVVMSVPAHAPVDWVALNNLQAEPESLADFGVTAEQILAIKPIPLIKVDGYGEYPAVEIIEEMGITDQTDPRIEEATKTIYKKEFHTGVLLPITQEWAGKKVSEVKDDLTASLQSKGLAADLKEPASRVRCRCGTQCHVKILENQWFLDYGNPEWKAKLRERIENVQFYPPEIRTQFKNTIEWLHEKACARKSGLGTPLPWDPNWIVETLSDSTIYMAYYTISKYVNQGKVKERNAIPELFDYIFLGKGDLKEVAKASKLTQKLIKEMKAEFEYWYPMDLRSSGKDLVQNHLTFMLFQHLAIFRPEHQPKAVAVNGFMSYEGQKMSKSKGVLQPLSRAVSRFGADLVRAGLLAAGEGLNDANFNETEVIGLTRWLETIRAYVNRIASGEEPDEDYKQIDAWLVSRMQQHARTVSTAIESMQTRTALTTALFATINDLRWYLRRRDDKMGPIFKEMVESVLKLLTPMIPHFCEEMWDALGHEKRISLEAYPEYDASRVDEDALAAEQLLEDVKEDIASISKVLKAEYSEIQLFVAAAWKYTAYETVRQDKKNAMKKIMSDPEMRKHGKAVSKFVQKLIKEPMLPPVRSKEQEFEALREIKSFLEKHFGAKIQVIHEEDSDNKRAELAIPGRVGIAFS